MSKAFTHAIAESSRFRRAFDAADIVIAALEKQGVLTDAMRSEAACVLHGGEEQVDRALALIQSKCPLLPDRRHRDFARWRYSLAHLLAEAEKGKLVGSIEQHDQNK